MPIDTLSTPLARVLTESAATPDWALLGCQKDEPVGEGVIVAGHGGYTAPAMLMILPFAGGVGATFDLRVYGWRHLSAPGLPDGDLWLPLLMAEFSCAANSGDPSGAGGRLLKASECLCDTMTLVAGMLGFYGSVFSVGDGAAAYARVDLQGVQKVQLVLRAVTGEGNALFAKVSAY